MTEIIYERTMGWLEHQKQEVDHSIGKLLNAWNINQPLSNLNPFQKKQAGFVLETLMAAYGLHIPQLLLTQIIESFYPGLDDHLKGGLTDNHKSLAVKIYGEGIATAIKYAPVLSGANEIGYVSPLNIVEVNGKTILNFDHEDPLWQLGIDFEHPPTHATTQFTFQDKTYFGKSYVDACVGNSKGGFVLIDSGHPCEQECDFCTYTKGELVINPDNFTKLEAVLDYLAQTTGKITACLSSGSSLSPDRSIPTVFEPMLEIIDQLKSRYPGLKVELELELMPWQISANQAILTLIEKYYQKGYIKAVNLNLETPLGIDRAEFMKDGNLGKSTIPIIGINGDNQGYLETFQLLQQHFPDLQLAGLILFGVKPPVMSWPEYTKLCLETVELFAQNGVKVLFQPVKISSTATMASYPLVDPFWLTGAVLLAGQIHMKYDLHNKHRVGCVNGCDACDSSRASYSLLKFAKAYSGEKALSQLLAPWISILSHL